MKCTACGQECFEEQHPEVVFKDENNCVCEECSIDYEEVNGKVRIREDLISKCLNHHSPKHTFMYAGIMR